MFCYEVIQDVYSSDKPRVKVKEDYRLKRYLIQQGAKKSGHGEVTVRTYKLVCFAFNVLRLVLKKCDDLRTAKNLAGFVPMIGDAIVQAEEEVKMAAFRVLTTIVKVPLKVTSDGTDLYRIATAEAFKSINASSTTTSDISQAALKLVSVVLRDRRDVPVRDIDVDRLLTKLKDDMTQPEHRHVTFNFLRAVMDAKVETAVVYDTLDYVGTVMVTNDDKDTRALARGAYFQFLHEYPQKKSRWRKQLAFIVGNLTYRRDGGRLSILEIIFSLLSKSSHEFVQEIATTCFAPLMLVLANDRVVECKEKAGELIKLIFSKAEKGRVSQFLERLREMVKQSNNPLGFRIAMQTFGFFYESQSMDDSDVDMLQRSILNTLETAEDSDSHWDQIDTALHLTQTLVKTFPETMLSSNSAAIWNAARRCLSYPHHWVKFSAATLASTYFEDFARSNIESNLQGLPLKNSGGLKLNSDDITDLLRRHVRMFKTPGLPQYLADAIVQNLTFLGICAGVNDVFFRGSQDAEDSDQDEDEDQDQDEGEDEEQADQRSALQYLCGRLSVLLRRETSPPRAEGLILKTAAMELLARLTSRLPADILLHCLPAILLPLQHLTDPAIPTPYSTDEVFRTKYAELKTNSSEMMERLKEKIGTKEYTEASLRVSRERRDKRMQRSSKRKIQAVSQPEKFGAQKRKKVERKKERRKEKGMEHKRRRHEY